MDFFIKFISYFSEKYVYIHVRTDHKVLKFFRTICVGIYLNTRRQLYMTVYKSVPVTCILSFQKLHVHVGAMNFTDLVFSVKTKKHHDMFCG